jgi:hypothetical protein
MRVRAGLSPGDSTMVGPLWHGSAIHKMPDNLYFCQ